MLQPLAIKEEEKLVSGHTALSASQKRGQLFRMINKKTNTFQIIPIVHFTKSINTGLELRVQMNALVYEWVRPGPDRNFIP
jgi:hypothetical protein